MMEEQPLRCLLVDDEFFALELMENYIKRLEGSYSIEKVRNPLVALRLQETEHFDIMFLDIQMPQLNGIILLNELLVKPVTVFTTAYSEFAAKAFDFEAADYLVKPFSFDRFSKAMDKAKKRVYEGKTSIDGHLQIKADRRWVNIPHKDILYVEGWKEYIRIHCIKQVYTTLLSFTKLEELLPESNFLRVHKSYLIAINKVSWVGPDELEVGNTNIPIARNRREYVKQRLVNR